MFELLNWKTFKETELTEEDVNNKEHECMWCGNIDTFKFQEGEWYCRSCTRTNYGYDIGEE